MKTYLSLLSVHLRCLKLDGESVLIFTPNINKSKSYFIENFFNKSEMVEVGNKIIYNNGSSIKFNTNNKNE